jgi:hypothetical protein
MAFGIKRAELLKWKETVQRGEEIAFITHYWLHPQFPSVKTVTKAGSSNLKLLISWGKKYGLKEEWIHFREEFPHFDLIGEKQIEVLEVEGLGDQLLRFQLKKPQ